MNYKTFLKELGISKFRLVWAYITKGWSGVAELVCVAFTNILGKVPPEKLKVYSELASKVARFIRYGIELFVTNEAFAKAGIKTAVSIDILSKHLEDSRYTPEELGVDVAIIS